MKACLANAAPCLPFLHMVIRPFPFAQQSRADLLYLFVPFKFALVHRIRNLLRDKDSFASQYCSQSILAQKMSEQKNPTCIAAFLSANPDFLSLFPRSLFFPEWTLCSLVILINSGILGPNNLFCNMKMNDFLISFLLWLADPILVMW